MPEDQYWTEPQSDYDSRRKAFVEFSSAAPGRGGRGGLFAQISRLESGSGPIDEGSIRDALSHVDARNDCADFTVCGLLRILLQYADSPLLSPDLSEAISRTLIGFKYWIDEPGEDDMMCFWSENHQIMFHSDEYLAGQLFSDHTFPNVGETGVWHQARARDRILRWIDLKSRVGFSEWDSNCYYDEDMAPLLNLADFAEDEEVARRATMILDVMFFDMAVDSFRGTYGTSHGRTYPGHVLSGRREATSGVQKIAWGLGCFNSPSNMTAVSLATSRRYRVPRAIELLAQDMPDELTNRERQSLRIEDAAELGIRFDDPDTAVLVWGAGKFANQRNVEATLGLADRFRSHRFGIVIRPYAEAVLGTYKELEAQGIPHDGDLDRTTLSQVNKVAYRTPDYQLSTAQDYRKGKPGFQQHIWQATLSPDAIVFTLHRGNADEERYKYWVGRFPRAVQHKNLLFALYDVPESPLPGPKTVFPPGAGGNAVPSPGPSEEELLPHTVAAFPRSAFDEVCEASGWVMARKGAGYLALRSQQPAEWTPDGVLRGEGLVAQGRRNIWVCQLGREAVDGAFADWCQRIEEADLEFGELSVRYGAPGIGEARCEWDGAFTVGGEEIQLHGYPRFDNPYGASAYGSGEYAVAFGDHRLKLDFQAGTREVTSP